MTVLVASCHTCLRCNLCAPRWIEQTGRESKAHEVPEEKQAKFELVARHIKGGEEFDRIRCQIREGDVIAIWMTDKEKRHGLLRGNIKVLSYMIMPYAHLAIAVKDTGKGEELRQFTSQGMRGPNTLDDLRKLERQTFDIYRIDKHGQLDLERLREFVQVVQKKANRLFAYNFVGMVGILSNHLEPLTPDEIGDDYLCSTAVAAALHYSGLDLDAVQCCEVLNMISPKRVVTSTGRMMTRSEMEAAACSRGSRNYPAAN